MAKQINAPAGQTDTAHHHTHLLANRKLLIGIAVLLILLASAAAALYFFLNQTNQDAAARTQIEIAEAQSKMLTTQINSLTDHMDDLASNPKVVASVADRDYGNPEIFEQAQEIRENHEYAIEVYIIPRGHTSAYDLTFAELDQVRRTERGERLPPEAIERNDEWHFIISVPIFDKDKQDINGTLFMAYRIDRILEPFKAFNQAKGSLSMVQVFENTRPRIIFTVGDFSPLLEEESLIKAGDSRWHVLFTPGPSFYQSSSPLYLLITLGILGIGLAVVIVFLLRNFHQTTTKEKKLAEEDVDRPIQIKGARTISKKGEVLAEGISDPDEQPLDDSDLDAISDPLFQSGDILDIAVMDEDDSDSDELSADNPEAETTETSHTSNSEFNPAIFRNYDIRGNAEKYISDEIALAIGKAIGSEAITRNETKVAVASDARISSPAIKAKLIEGLVSTGTSVVDIGNVPTPVMYYVTNTTDITSGVMVTASHNPASDNGFKIVLGGKSLTAEDIQKLQKAVEYGDFKTGQGQLSETSYTEAYCEEITSDIALAGNLKVVVDCANGITGELAPMLLEELGCDVVPLFCDLDGTFPNHDPDPSVASNLDALIQQVTQEGADLGVALDGDGDRLVAVSPEGKIIYPDELLMIFAKDIVSRNPGTDVIFDIKCTRRLNNLISGYGGRPLMWKSGHSNIKEKMLETGALLGGEFSGHIFFKERWHGFDDGLYATARLLEILTILDQNLDEIITAFPNTAITPEYRIDCDEDKKFGIIEKLQNKGEFSGGKITTLDGVRVDFAKGWGLARASNTSAHITLRFEADNDEMLGKITDMFKQQISKVAPDLTIDF